jgi:ureidoglycolate lyase
MDVHPLTAENFRAYGWLLANTTTAFSNQHIDFGSAHIFDPGVRGETEVLWVNYRNRQPVITSLEVHRLTQQAVIPITGDIIQIVAASQPDGSPGLDSIRAFRLQPGEGICMRPGCWHTTRVDAGEIRCLMLTRTSTTIDLVSHLTAGSPLSESAIQLLSVPLFM